MAKMTVAQELRGKLAEAELDAVEWKRRCDELVKEKEELEKKLSAEMNSKTMWYKSCDELNKEIEQVHQLLDSVPASIDRKSEAGEYGSRVERSLMTRLAAWLAVRKEN